MTDTLLVECNICEARVSGIVRGEIIGANVFDDGRYVLLECPSCEGPIVAHQHPMSLTHANEIVWSGASRIYPEVRSANPKIPESIRRSFEEALTCRRASALLATVVMCRKTIENVALHHYGKIRNLASALDKLHTDRI